jgi:hypothetical protein
MIEAMGLKVLHLGLIEWNYLCTKFRENTQSGSKVGDAQTDIWFDKLTFSCEK